MKPKECGKCGSRVFEHMEMVWAKYIYDAVKDRYSPEAEIVETADENGDESYYVCWECGERYG